MTATEVLEQLEQLGTEQTRKTWLRHGAKGAFFGVKIGDMKPIQKRIKIDYNLAKELFASGNSDAMYLAGLISDPAKMTRADLDNWAETATWNMISEYSVAWTAAESPLGFEAALDWINSPEPQIASTGWATLANWVALAQNDNKNIEKINQLLDRVEDEIFLSPNRVRYTMNNFVICVGAYAESLSEKAITIGAKIGKVEVDMSGTSCKVPFAPDYIKNSIARGSFTKKKKTVKC